MKKKYYYKMLLTADIFLSSHFILTWRELNVKFIAPF